MKVKSGYKRTEVGVIPEEWDVAPLNREIEGLDAGVSVNSVDEGLGSYGHDRAVLKTSAIAGGQFLPHESKVIASRDVGRAKLNPRKDSIIISRMNTPDLVGECGYVFADFPNLFLPDRLWMTRNRNGSDVCVNWLNYLLSSKPYKTRIMGLATGTSGSMKNIAKDALLSMLIPYPTPPEQGAIATALSDVDGLLGGLGRLIAKKRNLKQAAMQQLLTGQTRLPGFHGEWQVKRLKAIVQTPVTDGPHLTPRFLDDGIPFLSVNNLVENRIDLTELRFISRADHEVFSRKCKPRKDDILLGKAASVGKVALVELDIEFNIWSPIAMIRINCDNAPRFVYYQLHSSDLIGQITLLTNSSSQGNIGMGDIEKLTLKLPPLPEQAAIAEVLSDMDAELAALEQRREKTRALKQAMMQELLTGRTRLV